MWWSFFSTTLPYFEAVFLPLKQYPELGIDIRRQVLIAYRDYVILPLYPRLEGYRPFSLYANASHLLRCPTRNANQSIFIHLLSNNSNPSKIQPREYYNVYPSSHPY